jgi:glycosyltransferase involved in cell wall biosynthesis
VKILLLTWACDKEDISEPGVTYRWVREICKHHDVTLFSVSRPDRFGCVRKQFPDIPVIEWRDIWVPSKMERFRAIVKPGYFLYYYKAHKFLKRLLAENQFDVIHHLSPFAWRYASPAHGLKVPLVRGPVAGGLPTPKMLAHEVHETFHPFKFLRKTDVLRKRFDRNLICSYLHTDCVLIAAPYVLDILHPLPIQRYEVEIELGMEKTSDLKATLSVSPSKADKVKLLFVGRIIRTKGVLDAIRAVSNMNTKNSVQFSIIGDGEDLKNCQMEADKLGLTDVIIFRGWCSKEEVERAYQEADIFVFPSFREPTGGALLEAMSYGLPCITCDYGGPGYIVDERCGIRVPPMESEKYAQQLALDMDRLVNDKTLRETLGKGAKKHAEEDFAWENKMQRLTELYKQMVGGA